MTVRKRVDMKNYYKSAAYSLIATVYLGKREL